MIGECVELKTCLKNDLQSKLASVLFEGFFERGEDVADFGVLAGYAERVGLASREEVSYSFFFFGGG